MASTINLTKSPTTFSTSVQQKIKSREAALLIKNGSPKLRDLLREKCRIRMKEARTDSFLGARNLETQKKQLIKTIVREELAEMEEDIELQELIYKEIVENYDQWLWDDYERSENCHIEQLDENEGVFCPICQVSLLRLDENIISCCCGIRLYYPLSLKEFFEGIVKIVKKHEIICQHNLQFFCEPKDGFNIVSMSAFCPICDHFSPIVV